MREFGIDLSCGYLFRTLDSSRKIVLDKPVSSNVMYDRLKKYLKEVGIDAGETPHGMRGVRNNIVTFRWVDRGYNVAHWVDN